jgi:hypothetical protein
VTAGVEAPVQGVEPEAVESVAEDGLGDEQAVARDPQGLVEDALGIGAVVQGEQEQRGVEGPIAERQPLAVVHHVGARGSAEGPHVARDRPAGAPAHQRRRHVALAGAKVEDAGAGGERGQGGGLAARVPAEEALEHGPP